MSMVEKIRAVDAAFEHYAMGGSENDFYNADAAIAAALEEAEKVAAAFQRAREAFRRLRASGSKEVDCSPQDDDDLSLCDEFFGGDNG